MEQNDKKIIYTAVLESCSNGFDLLCALAFLMLGIYFVQSGQTTLGSLTAIYSLYGTFSFQFLQLGRYLPELIGCLVNARNIFEFLEEKEEPENWYQDRDADDGMNKVKPETPMLKLDEIEFYYRSFGLRKDYGVKAAAVFISSPWRRMVFGWQLLL